MKHRHDESVPAEFMRHVGNVLRCTCGRSYVAGYICPAEQRALSSDCPHGVVCKTSADCLARS